MTFLAAERLLLLVVVAAIAVAYLVLQARRRSYAVRFTNLALLERVAPRGPGWRRHVPAALFLVMLALLVTAFARPAMDRPVPREQATVALVIDVSISMEATDVEPSRIAAAQVAAKEFVTELPPRFNVSLVAFSGNATQLVSPTTDRAEVMRAIDSLQLGPRTAIGEGVFTALDGLRSFAARYEASPAEGAAPTEPEAGVPPARIVLLSDGENTVGRLPAAAAGAAAAAEVPISAIAYGTPYGTVAIDGQVIPVPADGPTLRTMAQVTEGSYHEAGSADELAEVYESIGSSVGTTLEEQEIATWFVGLGLLAAMAAGICSLLWFGRLP